MPDQDDTFTPVQQPSNILVLGGNMSIGQLQATEPKEGEEAGYVPAIILDLRIGVLLPEGYGADFAEALSHIAKGFTVVRQDRPGRKERRAFLRSVKGDRDNDS